MVGVSANSQNVMQHDAYLMVGKYDVVLVSVWHLYDIFIELATAVSPADRWSIMTCRSLWRRLKFVVVCIYARSELRIKE